MIIVKNNLATTSMMLPLALSIAKEINSSNEINENECCLTNENNNENNNNNKKKEEEEVTNKANNITKAFCLCTSFSSSIGCYGSLIGSNANILLKGYADKSLSNDNLNFFKFFLYGFPITCFMIIFEWLILCLFFLRSSSFSKTIKQVDLSVKIKEKLAKFGNMKYFFLK